MSTPDPVAAADLADKYDQMLRLADAFDDAGAQMRDWSEVGRSILAEAEVAESAPLSPATWGAAEEEVRAATTGKGGLLSRSIELDADALVLRATVLTYRWIDDLQAAAYETLGSIAGRAIGYLAPEVSLGGAIVAAGLIETDALDRDGVAAYLGELAAANPELMEHVATGGGLLDSLQMRGLLTAGALGGEDGRPARSGGLRAIGAPALDDGWAAALRDAAAGLEERPLEEQGAEEQGAGERDTATDGAAAAPRGLGDLMGLLVVDEALPVRLLRVAPGRLVALLGDTTTPSATPGPLRLVTGDLSTAARTVTRFLEGTIRATADGDGPTHVMVVGRGRAGAVALEVATRTDRSGFVVDEVVTADAPAAQPAALPDGVRVVSLEDRTDPVAVLGSLVNAGAANRLTVVYDATDSPDLPAPVAAGRAADAADHPDLHATLERWRAAGYLS